MMKLLVPTDFSDTAENGLKLATDILKKIGGEIILLNVIYPVPGTTFTAMGDINNLPRGKADRFMAELVRKNKSKLDKEIEKYGSDKIKIIPRMDFVDKVDGLKNYVKEHELDLIVMGTKGSKSLTEYLFGTHTERVIKVSECPVISIKGPAGKFYPDNIVFAVDINNENYEGIERLKDFANTLNGTVHLLYVVDDGIETNEALEKLESLARETGFNQYTLNTVNNHDAESTIRNYAKRKSADMIAVVAEGKTGVRELLFGSVTNDIINNIEIPVFVISN
jgi:nucleotide-binding universal stress UspA family protein